MKTLLTLAIVLLLAQSIQAQIPTPVENAKTQSAVLKEWWRADNMGYGVQGMTWLENFYNGQGALVIHTPKGVKTWLLRYPGDTANVFTWNGNDAVIKTGDFNGDGVTDYVDQRGQIYVGIQNGQPPEPLYVRTQNAQGPHLVMDFDADGKDDLLFIDVLSPEITIAFGDNIVQNISYQKYPIEGIGVNSYFIHGYPTAANDLRVLTYQPYRQVLTKYPYKRAISEGFRLMGYHWNESTKSIESKTLADTTWFTPDSTGIYITSQISSMTGKPEFLLCSMIKGSYWKSMLSTYDLSADRFRLASHVRCDSVSYLIPLRYSLDGDSVPSLCIVRSNPWYQKMYKGNTEDTLTEIGSIGLSVPTQWTLAITKLPHLKYASLAMAGYYALNGDEATAISFSTLPDSVSNVGTDSANSELKISVQPSPARADRLDIRVETKVSGVYHVDVCDLSGRRIQESADISLNVGQQSITITLVPRALAAGVYVLRVYNESRSCSQTFTIQ